MYEAWANPADPRSFDDWGEVEIQVVGTPTVAYTPQRSIDGVNYYDANAYDKDGAPVATITVAGIYSIEGGAYVKLINGTDSAIGFRPRGRETR